MCQILKTVLFGILIQSSYSAKLPAYIKPCSLSDPKLNECALQSAINAFPSVVKGDKNFKVSSLMPLHLDQVLINVGNSLEMKFNNLTISGIDTGIVDKINIDPIKKEWQIQLTAKHLTMLLSYDINGRILLLPIVGSGPGNLSLENPVITYEFKYDLIEKKNMEFINIQNPKFTYKATKMHFNLERLFNGDERLGNAMNSFLNENWYEVNNEIGPSIEETMNSVVTSVFKSYFQRVPMQYLFTT